MQEERAKLRQNENGMGVLNNRRILSHYRNLAGGQHSRQKCSFCSNPMGAIDPVPKIEKPKPDVVQDSGTDETGDTSLASVGRRLREEDSELPETG